jgi:hypothetical protein
MGFSWCCVGCNLRAANCSGSSCLTCRLCHDIPMWRCIRREKKGLSMACVSCMAVVRAPNGCGVFGSPVTSTQACHSACCAVCRWFTASVESVSPSDPCLLVPSERLLFAAGSHSVMVTPMHVASLVLHIWLARQQDIFLVWTVLAW